MRPGPIVVLALAVAVPAASDVLLPGQKSVSHEIYIEGMDRFPEYTFFIGPVTMTGGVQRVTPDEALGFYKFASPRLYAVKGPAPESPDLALVADPKNPRSEERFSRVSSVSKSSPTKSIRTTYTIKSIEGGLIKLERADKVSRISGDPSDLALALVSLAGALGLVLTVRLRYRFAG